MKRKIIVYIATSADGFIARKDGAVDWLDRPSPKGNYGMGEFWKSIDTILFGRKTYDMSVKFVKEGKATPDMFAGGVKHYAFSRKPPKKVLFGFEFVNEPIKKFVKRLRAERGKDIWMMGGASIIRSFLDADAIDEFIIHVIPTFIGEGIPLIAPKRRTLPLKLLSTKKYPDGVVRLHYQVIRQK
ncbi:MAG TPA: dihydrofolate reductase family protein [Pyrinomonadaceae bacterium]|jgi:dihydrofolate reductase|nr:dihydrofolate reductase family protein [Pyrinomonadaceae bacterium]